MKPDRRGVLEACAFALATLVYIWALRRTAPWTLWILVVWSVAAIAWRAGSLDAAGLSPRRFAETVLVWSHAFLACLLALGFVLQERLADPDLLLQGAVYFLWCCVQQTVYQNLIYRRVKSTLGVRPASWALSGVIFGIVHLPNPVLVPATAAWGAASSFLFEKRPSIPALAMAQVALSSVLYELTPPSWHHGFRVGPGYWTR